MSLSGGHCFTTAGKTYVDCAHRCVDCLLVQLIHIHARPFFLEPISFAHSLILLSIPRNELFQASLPNQFVYLPDQIPAMFGQIALIAVESVEHVLSLFCGLVAILPDHFMSFRLRNAPPTENERYSFHNA